MGEIGGFRNGEGGHAIAGAVRSLDALSAHMLRLAQLDQQSSAACDVGGGGEEGRDVDEADDDRARLAAPSISTLRAQLRNAYTRELAHIQDRVAEDDAIDGDADDLNDDRYVDHHEGGDDLDHDHDARIDGQEGPRHLSGSIPPGYAYREVAFAVTCPLCDGSRRVRRRRRVETCPECEGVGRVVGRSWEVVPVGTDSGQDHRSSIAPLLVVLVIIVLVGAVLAQEGTLNSVVAQIRTTLGG